MNVEGKNAVAEALKSDATIDVIMVEKGINHPIIAIARDKGIKLRFLDKNTMDKMSVTKRHQGFIAVTSDFEYCDVSDILDYAKSRNEDAFVVLLDGVEDPALGDQLEFGGAQLRERGRGRAGCAGREGGT